MGDIVTNAQRANDIVETWIAGCGVKDAKARVVKALDDAEARGVPARERSAVPDPQGPCSARPSPPGFAAVDEPTECTPEHVELIARGLWHRQIEQIDLDEETAILATGEGWGQYKAEAAEFCAAVRERSALIADEHATNHEIRSVSLGPDATAAGIADFFFKFAARKIAAEIRGRPEDVSSEMPPLGDSPRARSAGRAENGPLPVSEADRDTTSLRVERDALREALTKARRCVVGAEIALARDENIAGAMPLIIEARALLSPPDEKTTP